MTTTNPGRPEHKYWEEGKFKGVIINGRRAAYCKICRSVLKNSAISRLQCHRRNCPPKSKTSGEFNTKADTSFNNMGLPSYAFNNSNNNSTATDTSINDTLKTDTETSMANDSSMKLDDKVTVSGSSGGGIIRGIDDPKNMDAQSSNSSSSGTAPNPKKIKMDTNETKIQDSKTKESNDFKITDVQMTDNTNNNSNNNSNINNNNNNNNNNTPMINLNNSISNINNNNNNNNCGDNNNNDVQTTIIQQLSQATSLQTKKTSKKSIAAAAAVAAAAAAAKVATKENNGNMIEPISQTIITALPFTSSSATSTTPTGVTITIPTTNSIEITQIQQPLTMIPKNNTMFKKSISKKSKSNNVGGVCGGISGFGGSAGALSCVNAIGQSEIAAHSPTSSTSSSSIISATSLNNHNSWSVNIGAAAASSLLPSSSSLTPVVSSAAFSHRPQPCTSTIVAIPFSGTSTATPPPLPIPLPLITLQSRSSTPVPTTNLTTGSFSSVASSTMLQSSSNRRTLTSTTQQSPTIADCDLSNGHLTNSSRLQHQLQQQLQINGTQQNDMIMDTSDNEFLIFGRSIAIQLNKLPLEMSLRLQLKIQNLITDERLSFLRSIQNLPPMESSVIKLETPDREFE